MRAVNTRTSTFILVILSAAPAGNTATSTCAATHHAIDTNVFGLSVTYRGQSNLPQLLGDSGATWGRIDFHWGFIDHLDGTYRWTEYDALLQGLKARGINVVATIDDIPSSLLRSPTSDWTPV